MTPGNPELVIHDGDTICEQFIDRFLEGYNVEVTADDVVIPIYVTGHDTDPGDGFPLIVGYRLDDDYNFDDQSDHICIHWQTITRIEVW